MQRKPVAVPDQTDIDIGEESDEPTEIISTREHSRPTAAGKVASFFGLDDDDELSKWRDKMLVRAESNNIGFQFKNLLPPNNESDRVDSLLSALQRRIDHAESNRALREQIIDTYFPNEEGEQLHENELQKNGTANKDEHPMRRSVASLFKSSKKHVKGRCTSAPQQPITKEPTFLSDTPSWLKTPARSIPSETGTLYEHQDVDLQHEVELLDSRSLAVDEDSLDTAVWTDDLKSPTRHKELDLDKTEDEIGWASTLTFPSQDEMPVVRTNGHNVSRSELRTEKIPPFQGYVQQQLSKYQTSQPSPKYAASSSSKRRSLDFKQKKSNVTFSNFVEEHYEERTIPLNFVRSLFKRPSVRTSGRRSQHPVDSLLQTNMLISPPKSILKVPHSQEFPVSSYVDSTDMATVHLSEENLDLTDSSEWLYYDSAWLHYLSFRQIEKEERVNELRYRKDKIADKIQKQIDDLKNGMNETEVTVQDIPDNTKGKLETFLDFFKTATAVGPYSPRRYPTHTENVHVAMQVENMPTYTPWFTYVISALQILTMIFLLAMGDIAPVGMIPKVVLRPNTLTFSGLATVDHWELKNPWVGPSLPFLIHAGAVFSPCMRNDQHLFRNYDQKYDVPENLLGCCEVKSRNTAGTTTQAECNNVTGNVGVWLAGVKCSLRSPNMIQVPHVIKPCCIGFKAQCVMVTLEHCVFLIGHFFTDGPEHCSETNCLSPICGFTGLKSDEKKPYRPDFANQVWRLWLAIFLHHGLLEVVLILLVQLVICRQLELMAGWFRILLIYIVSASLGFLTAATMTPYIPHMGGGGALMGLIGVLYVELVQSWHLLLHPYVEAAKLMVLTLCFLFVGTVPYVDNFGFTASFVYGILLGIIFLPYITFGKWHTYRRRILVVISFILLTFFALISFVVFFDVQSITDWCSPVCKRFSCIPYADRLCEFPDLW